MAARRSWWIGAGAPWLVGVLLGCACSPVTVVHTAPQRPAKPDDCAVAVLSAPPARPYVALAQLRVRNCPDPAQAPCRDWVRASACALGADALILPEATARDGRDDRLAPAENWVVTAVAYSAPGAGQSAAPEGDCGAQPDAAAAPDPAGAPVCRE